MAQPGAPAKVLQELLQLELGLKQAVKVEHVTAAEEAAVRGLAAERGLSVLADEEPEPSTHGRLARPSTSLFLGTDGALLEQLREWSRTQRRPGRSSATQHEALRRIGAVLGYPSCCVEAYIRGREFPDQSLVFLRPAFGTEGIARALLNPAGNDELTSHVPCSFACDASLALARTTAAALEARDPAAWAARRGRMLQPVLVLGERGTVRLAPTDDDDPRHDRVRFRAADTSSLLDGELRSAFERADTLVLAPASFRLLAGGAIIHEERRQGPLDLPLLLRFEGPARRRLEVEFVDLHRSRVDYMDTMTLALLSGDLTHLGVANSVVRQYGDREHPERWGTSRERLIQHLGGSRATWVVWNMAFDEAVAAAARAAGKVGVLIDGRFGGDPVPFDLVFTHPSRQGFARACRLWSEGHDLPAVPKLLGRAAAGWQRAPTLDSLPRLERTEDATFWPNTVYSTLPGEYRPPSEVWHLSVNPGCPYGKRVEDNDAFRGLTFPEGVSTRGCSFCEEGGDYDGAPAEPTLKSLLHQLDFLVRRAPHGRWVVLERAVFRFLPRFLERASALMAEAGRTQARPEFYVTARTDELVREERHIIEAVETAERLGMSLVLYLVGFENFSQPTLDLFNKGSTVETQLAALALIRRLERDHGRAFTASRAASHGILLFTPWTTLAELRENARWLRETRFWELRSEATLSKLRLYATVPLYHKALAEGLLTDAFATDNTSMSERLGYSHESPWRFLHDDVAAVYRLLLTQADHYPRNAQEVALLDAAIAAVEAEGPGVDAAAFAERWSRSLPRRPSPGRPERPVPDLPVPPACGESGPLAEAPRRALAERILASRAEGQREIVLRGDRLLEAPRAVLWAAAACARAGFTEVGLLVDPAHLTPGRLDALARAGVTRILPWVDARSREPAALAGSAALDASTLEVLPALEVDAATLSELPALGDLAARLHPRAGAIALGFAPGPLAHQGAGPGELPLVRLQEAAHAAGLGLRALGTPPPPCAFESGRALRDLFLFMPDATPAGFHRIAACDACAVRARCPGVSEDFSRRSPEALLLPVRDDLLR